MYRFLIGDFTYTAGHESAAGERRYIVSYRNEGKKEKTPLLSEAMIRIAKDMLSLQGATHIRVIDKRR